MIVGIGTDIIEVERVNRACERTGFLARSFTEKELEIINRRKSCAAGNFAVKEAVSKVFGTGFRGIKLKDIEVLRDELGAPYVVLYGGAKEKADKLGIDEIKVSISDTKDMAVAFVVGTSKES